MAQGILENKLVKNELQWFVDSAGTSGWHDGQHPDPRAISSSSKYGVDISTQYSRKIKLQDLDVFDHILVMDSSNYQEVIRLCKNDTQKEKVELILNFVKPRYNAAVPDPYYQGNFDEVFVLLDQAIDKFIEWTKMEQT